MKKLITSALLLTVIYFNAVAQHKQLWQQIDKIAAGASGKVGVALELLETGDSLTYNDHTRFVLHSVMKFPIAMKVLNDIDYGKAQLEQTIHITKEDLPKTYSPLRDENPEGNVDVPISKLLRYMVSLSDNNACDILLKHFGGTVAVRLYVEHLGLKYFNIHASEAEMAAKWPMQYTNWTKPSEIIRMLKNMHEGKTLSKNSNAFLQKIMLETKTGPKRIKGLLQVGTPVAHKTGTSGTNEAGLSPATNDVGIITLPNGRHLAIAIFILDSTDNIDARELTIAKIAKAAFDEFGK